MKKRVLALVASCALWTACGGDDSPAVDGGTGDDGGTVPTSASCEPLGAPPASAISLGPTDDVAAALNSAQSGDVFVLADGTYNVPSDGWWIGADDVVLRSASGDPTMVVLDADYGTGSGGVVNIAGRTGVTVAELTIRRARFHSVHVTGGQEGPSIGARLYRITAEDSGEQAIKINSNYGFDSDDGEVACSSLRLTDTGRTQVMGYTSSGSNCYTGGVDAHRASGWTIRDNRIEGFWCSNDDLSEHGIHLWSGSRGTLVDRNLLINNARGIGFGLGEPDDPRTYDDDPCGSGVVAGHYQGLIRNNMVVATRDELFASPNGMDLGIGLEAACYATVAHNSVASTQAPFSSIEWRFGATTATLVNNLVSHNLRDRDGNETMAGNVEGVGVDVFVDLAGHDLHLSDSASVALGTGDPTGTALAPMDFDGDARGDSPDVGADER